ncbi:hypothetical protein KW794_02480 [Candidatus Saccharibacteria bacterium]|nr:hypothetical protein [Candidatus Saccharibacteria bacterium]
MLLYFADSTDTTSVILSLTLFIFLIGPFIILLTFIFYSLFIWIYSLSTKHAPNKWLAIPVAILFMIISIPLATVGYIKVQNSQKTSSHIEYQQKKLHSLNYQLFKPIYIKSGYEYTSTGIDEQIYRYSADHILFHYKGKGTNESYTITVADYKHSAIELKDLCQRLAKDFPLTTDYGCIEFKLSNGQSYYVGDYGMAGFGPGPAALIVKNNTLIGVTTSGLEKADIENIFLSMQPINPDDI